MTINTNKSLVYALACVVSWAFIPVVSKLGQQSLDNYQFLFWSSALSFIVLLFASIGSGKFKVIKKYTLAQIARTSFLGFLGSYLYYLLLYFAYSHARGLEVLVLQYTWPLFIVILSIPILKEKLTLPIAVSTILGFIGVLVVLTKGDFRHIYLANFSTDLIVLFAAAMFGLFSVLSKKIHLEYYLDTTIYFGTAAILAFFSMTMFSHFALPKASAIIPLIINGALINGLSYVFWLKALRYGRASFVAPLVFITPVLAALLLVIIFKEVFLPIYGLGICMVLIAGIYSQFNKNGRN